MVDPVRPSETEFCPNQTESYQSLFDLLPPGRAFGTRPFTYDIDTNIKRFFFGIGGTWSRLEAAVCRALDDWFCFTSQDDIDRWETDYGIPDECDLYSASVCAKVAASSPPSAQYLTNLLETNGYVGQGRWLTGDDLEFPGVYSTFRMVVDPLLSPAYIYRTVIPFSMGDFRYLGYPDITHVACMLERYVPAHTAISAVESSFWEPVTGLGTDLIAWWTADDTVDGAVSSWSSRGTIIAATGAGATRPVSSLVDVGGVSTVRFVTFDGVDDFLELASVAGLLNGATPGEVWGFVNQAAPADTIRTAFSYGGPTSYRGLDMQPVGSNSRFSPHIEVSYSDELSVFDGYAVVGARHDGTQLRGKINGIFTEPSALADATINTPTTRGRIGASSNLTVSQFWSGSVRYIFVTKPLTETQAIRLEAWMAWNSGLPIVLDGSHPYRNVRP